MRLGRSEERRVSSPTDLVSVNRWNEGDGTVMGAGVASREGGYLVNKRVNLGMVVQPRRERRLPRTEGPVHHIFLRLPDELLDGALPLPDR